MDWHSIILLPIATNSVWGAFFPKNNRSDILETAWLLFPLIGLLCKQYPNRILSIFFFLFSAAMMKLYHKECLQIRQQVIIFKQSLKTPLQMLLCFVSSDSSDQAHQIVGVFVVPYIAWRSCCFLLKSEEIWHDSVLFAYLAAYLVSFANIICILLR